eukprot:TRINITY_DN6169_c0_g4_i1.p1 TRINITY_DN6169_c0_g4~~TRINITY_DN6169_c0_g4_i1.p1  ORF type:complete len:435 (+),score=81.51 TRINITY_DN6169_c0_g4_i1:3-1307(+)
MTKHPTPQPQHAPHAKGGGGAIGRLMWVIAVCAVTMLVLGMDYTVRAGRRDKKDKEAKNAMEQWTPEPEARIDYELKKERVDVKIGFVNKEEAPRREAWFARKGGRECQGVAEAPRTKNYGLWEESLAANRQFSERISGSASMRRYKEVTVTAPAEIKQHINHFTHLKVVFDGQPDEGNPHHNIITVQDVRHFTLEIEFRVKTATPLSVKIISSMFVTLKNSDFNEVSVTDATWVTVEDVTATGVKAEGTKGILLDKVRSDSFSIGQCDGLHVYNSRFGGKVLISNANRGYLYRTNFAEGLQISDSSHLILEEAIIPVFAAFHLVSTSIMYNSSVTAPFATFAHTTSFFVISTALPASTFASSHGPLLDSTTFYGKLLLSENTEAAAIASCTFHDGVAIHKARCTDIMRSTMKKPCLELSPEAEGTLETDNSCT